MSRRFKASNKIENPRVLTATQVQAWFREHSANMIVALESGDYFEKFHYIGGNENVFFSQDGLQMLKATVSYEEGCPTCGGAWIKDWTLTTF
jgi:hypothetical protein